MPPANRKTKVVLKMACPQDEVLPTLGAGGVTEAVSPSSLLSAVEDGVGVRVIKKVEADELDSTIVMIGVDLVWRSVVLLPMLMLLRVVCLIVRG